MRRLQQHRLDFVQSHCNNQLNNIETNNCADVMLQHSTMATIIRNSTSPTIQLFDNDRTIIRNIVPSLFAERFRNFCQPMKRAYQVTILWFCSMFCCCLPNTCHPNSPINERTHSLTMLPFVQFQHLCCTDGLRTRLIVALVWVIAVLFSIPHAMFNAVVHYDFGIIKMTRCRSNMFSSLKQQQALTMYTFCTQYLVPIGLTAYFYFHIGVFLWRRETVGQISERRRAMVIHCKRRRVMVLILVVAAFAICWFPLNLYLALIDFQLITNNIYIFFAVHWLAMSSVCYNPFIYCWLNEGFRHKMIEFIQFVIPTRWLVFCCGASTLTTEMVLNESGVVGSNLHRCMRLNLNNGFDSDNHLSGNSITSCKLNSTAQEQAINEIVIGGASSGVSSGSSDLGTMNGRNSETRNQRAQRLAMATTQSGRRRVHMIPYQNESETKTTSIGGIDSLLILDSVA